MLQAHAEYLASMRVIQVQQDKGQLHTKVYDGIMNHLLEEATAVPELVEAMLLQIEDNFKESDDKIDSSTRNGK